MAKVNLYTNSLILDDNVIIEFDGNGITINKYPDYNNIKDDQLITGKHLKELLKTLESKFLYYKRNENEMHNVPTMLELIDIKSNTFMYYIKVDKLKIPICTVHLPMYRSSLKNVTNQLDSLNISPPYLSVKSDIPLKPFKTTIPVKKIYKKRPPLEKRNINLTSSTYFNNYTQPKKDCI